MSKINSELSYNEAVSKIKSITAEIEQLDGDLDTLIIRVKELKELILFCEGKVMDAETEIRDIFEEE